MNVVAPKVDVEMCILAAELHFSAPTTGTERAGTDRAVLASARASGWFSFGEALMVSWIQVAKSKMLK